MKWITTNLCIAALLFSGCAWIDELGSDESKAEFYFSAAENLDEKYTCMSEQFPLTLKDFDIDNPFDADIQVQMYENISRQVTTNYVTLILATTNAETLEPCPTIGSSEGMSLAVGPNACARVYVQFNACTKTVVTAQVTGNLELTSFSTERKGRIEGSLSGQLQDIQRIQTSDGNGHEIITDLGEFSGTFAFSIHAGGVWNK